MFDNQEKQNNIPEPENNTEDNKVEVQPTVSEGLHERMERLRGKGEAKKIRKRILFIFIIILLGGLGAARFLYWPEISVFMGLNKEDKIACTLEAKVCPDGSNVGRVPPSCEFAKCPEEVEKIDIKSWQNYKNESLGLEFNYPKNWTLDDSGEVINFNDIEEDLIMSVAIANTNFMGLTYCVGNIDEERCENIKITDELNAIVDWGVDGTANAKIGDSIFITLHKVTHYTKTIFSNILLSTKLIRCAEEGQTFSVVSLPEGYGISCCGELIQGEVVDIINNQCIPEMDVAVCIDCPNGECGEGENKCNCPEDCEEEIADTSSLQSEVLTKDWQTYRNEEFRFEVKYPGDWNYKHNNGTIEFREEGEKYEVEGSDIHGIGISVNDINTSLTNEKWSEMIKSSGGAVNKINIDNKEAVQVIYYLGKITKINYKNYNISISSPNFGSDDLNNEIYSIYDTIISTFKFLKDTDNDGLYDDEEAIYGTDINNSDTDGDGYLDGDEVKNGYNPNGEGKLLN